MDLRTRIAKALGWSEQEVVGFSLLTLREMVKPISAKLTAEIDEVVRTGSYIVGSRR